MDFRKETNGSFKVKENESLDTKYIAGGSITHSKIISKAFLSNKTHSSRERRASTRDSLVQWSELRAISPVLSGVKWGSKSSSLSFLAGITCSHGRDGIFLLPVRIRRRRVMMSRSSLFRRRRRESSLQAEPSRTRQKSNQT